MFLTLEKGLPALDAPPRIASAGAKSELPAPRTRPSVAGGGGFLPARTCRVLDRLTTRPGARASLGLDSRLPRGAARSQPTRLVGMAPVTEARAGVLPLLAKHPDPGPGPFEPVGWQVPNGVLSQMGDVCQPESVQICPMPR